LGGRRLPPLRVQPLSREATQSAAELVLQLHSGKVVKGIDFRTGQRFPHQRILF
jgi:hypothetical protein